MCFAVLLALALFAAAWFHTFSEWESTWRALVAPFAVKAPAPVGPLLLFVPILLFVAVGWMIAIVWSFTANRDAA